jgi:hypothetical protein
MIDWEFPPEDELRNIMRAMNDLLAGLPVQAGLAILADLIADGIRPTPPRRSGPGRSPSLPGMQASGPTCLRTRRGLQGGTSAGGMTWRGPDWRKHDRMADTTLAAPHVHRGRNSSETGGWLWKLRE